MSEVIGWAACLGQTSAYKTLGQSLVEIGLAIPRAWRFLALQGIGYGFGSEL